MNSFSQLPQRVIFKYNNSELAARAPDNVLGRDGRLLPRPQLGPRPGCFSSRPSVQCCPGSLSRQSSPTPPPSCSSRTVACTACWRRSITKSRCSESRVSHAPFHSRYCCYAVFVDQADVLRRIEDRGIGRGLAKTATVTEITTAVQEVTANDTKIEGLYTYHCHIIYCSAQPLTQF